MEEEKVTTNYDSSAIQVLEGLEGVTDIEVKADKQLHGKLIIDAVQFDVTVDDKGQEHYTANGETFTSQY